MCWSLYQVIDNGKYHNLVHNLLQIIVSKEDKYSIFSVMSIMKEAWKKSRALIWREANHIFLNHYHLVIQVRNLTFILQFWPSTVSHQIVPISYLISVPISTSLSLLPLLKSSLFISWCSVPISASSLALQIHISHC